MGLEELEADIRKRIESKVSSILAEAETEAGQIIAKGKDQVATLRKQRSEEIEKLAKEYKNREIAQAYLNSRKMKLEVKKEALEELFLKIEEKLHALSSHERKEILSALVEKGKRELPDAKFVYSNKDDKKEASLICKKEGLNFAGTVDCKGGVIIENKSKEVRLDYTYEALLADFRKEAINDIATGLFGGNK